VGGKTCPVTWRTPIYAIVRSGGKQYRVEPAQTVDVDRIQADVGSTIDLSVLMLGGNGDVQVGAPLVDGARVVAEIVEHGRGDKIIVFKYKNKTRYRRRYGHRQDFTRLSIREIVTESGSVKAEEKPKPARRKKAEPAAETTPEAVEAAAADAPDATTADIPEVGAPAEQTEKPKRPRRAAKPKAARAAAEAAGEAAEAAETVGEGIEAAAGPAGDDDNLPPPTRTRIQRKSPEGKAPKPGARKKKTEE
jgi:large subunit ribosomal protein L21